jgi:hypothetical protein
MTQFKAQHIPYKRTSTEWEILGDLALRLHKREEVRSVAVFDLAYCSAGQGRIPAGVRYPVLGQGVDRAAVHVCGGARRWPVLECGHSPERVQPAVVPRISCACGSTCFALAESCRQYPSEVGHQLFKLMQQEGVSKVSYSLVSMRLPDSILKMMQCVPRRRAPSILTPAFRRYFEDAAWLLQPDH